MAWAMLVFIFFYYPFFFCADLFYSLSFFLSFWGGYCSVCGIASMLFLYCTFDGKLRYKHIYIYIYVCLLMNDEKRSKLSSFFALGKKTICFLSGLNFFLKRKRRFFVSFFLPFLSFFIFICIYIYVSYSYFFYFFSRVYPHVRFARNENNNNK